MTSAIMFTDDELRTIVSAANNHYNELLRKELKAGNHSKTETMQRVHDISKKAYSELTRRHAQDND